MKAPFLPLTACALLGLAACSSEPEPGSDATDAADTGMASETASDNSPASVDLGEGIPPAIQGRWGLAASDCTQERGLATGLVEIAPGSIEFYESMAELESMDDRSGDMVRGTFTFSGEGETWSSTVSLELADGGSRLVRRDSGPDALPDPITYQRCD